MTDRYPSLQNYTRPSEPGVAAQGAPGQYPEYQVGGAPYSRVNPNLPPIIENGLTWAASKAAGLQAAFDKSTPAQVYKQAVLDRRQQPFTERDFGQQDMESLARAIVRSQTDGRGMIQRSDYVGADKRLDGPFQNVIGRANYTLDKAGNAVVNDTYDFNNYERNAGHEDTYYTPIGSDTAAWLGRRALPSGVRGVPVQINVPHEMLENALSGMGMVK